MQKALDQLGRKDHTREQQREIIQRLVHLLVNKLLHQPTAALREARGDEATLRAEVLCELFGLEPVEGERESQPALAEPQAEPERKAAT